ncbi:hypothetical protein LSAT2_009809 [Lamellibrachia satsuma]|nr:hypothetical protein LSAT2_009809 [Lamellibrachia satsuma]
MSKIFVALMVVTIAYASQGCSDSCRWKQPGVPFPSYCGPANRYHVCIRGRVVYRYCPKKTQCLIRGACGRCQDQCNGKPNGDYQSLDNPPPFYYHCQNGALSYRTCHPNEIFNAWTRWCGVIRLMSWLTLDLAPGCECIRFPRVTTPPSNNSSSS